MTPRGVAIEGSCSLDNGVVGHCGDAAHVVVILGHHDVALHAPLGSPTVLHLPVRLPIEFTVAHNEDAVIKVLAGTPVTLVDSVSKNYENIIG